jgi:peptidoglycan/LPS O-acetylase OafA/YrhL
VSFLSARWIGSDFLTLLLSVAASIAAAVVFWYLLERPSLAFAHRIRVKKSDKPPMSDSGTAAARPQNAIGELQSQPLDERRSS